MKKARVFEISDTKKIQEEKAYLTIVPGHLLI